MDAGNSVNGSLPDQGKSRTSRARERALEGSWVAALHEPNACACLAMVLAGAPVLASDFFTEDLLDGTQAYVLAVSRSITVHLY